MIVMGHDHLGDDALNGLAKRRLPPREVADALRHLEACAACRARAEAYAPRPSPLSAQAWALDGGEGHLDDADLVAYVDAVARPDQIEIVETHAEDCGPCRAQLDDLLALRAGARRPSIRTVRWIAIAASLFIAVALLGIFVRTREEPREIPRVTPRATAVPALTEPIATTKPPAENPEWGQLVSASMRTGELPFPGFLATLAGESDGLRGPASEPADGVAPAGIVVDTTRPQFSWPARGKSSVVLVYEGETEVLRSKAMAGGRWKASRDLERGRTYTWQVEVTENGETDYLPAPPAPPAMFHIVSEQEHRAIEEARRARPDDHILHAVLLAKAGLRAEALASLRAAGDDPNARDILVRYEKP